MILEAKIIADSQNERGQRLTTFEVTHARFVLAELNTHRVFSRNGASSRAIPLARRIKAILENTAEPVVWGREEPGMQANAFLTPEEVLLARAIWNDARDDAIKHATRLAEIGAHKQICNRLLEPFAVQRTLISSTAYENFWALRCHKDADPTFRETADLMLEAYEHSKPVIRPDNDTIESYHLPYVTPTIYDKIVAEAFRITHDLSLDVDTDAICALEALRPFAPASLAHRLAVLYSAACCAAVSYKTVDGQELTLEKASAIFKKLILSKPVHASPLEHQGKASASNIQSGNLRGFWQARQFIDGHVVEG